MGRNVEIKARVRDPLAIRRAAEQLADDGPHELIQEDTFFPCPDARLKLRKLGEEIGELIWYSRPDAEGPKESRYERYPTEAPDHLRDVLARALGVRGVVRKRRLLLMAGRTRIHLDAVEGLGDFMELEVVLTGGETLQDGEREARALMQQLGIEESDLIEGAYIDLLHPPPPPPREPNSASAS